MVAATAAIRCMRRNYPDAQIDLLLRPYVRPVIENAIWFNRIIELDDKRGGLFEMLRIAHRLREPAPYDLALLLTHSFRSAFIAWRSKATRRVGHARHGRSWMLSDPVPWPGEGATAKFVAKVEIYSSLMEYLGCVGAREQHPQVFTSEQDEGDCKKLLLKKGWNPERPLFCLVPGAKYGGSKLWPPDRFAAVGEALANRHHMQPVILTGPGEETIGHEIARNIAHQPILFLPKEASFGVVKSAVRRSVLMVCNDTGPRHIAIAYNVPVVVLMGPTDPRVTHSDYARTVILRQNVPCGPCYLRQCPTDHRCMKLITPQMVIDAAEDLLRLYPIEPAQ